jgi:hypothetical protein
MKKYLVPEATEPKATLNAKTDIKMRVMNLLAATRRKLQRKDHMMKLTG